MPTIYVIRALATTAYVIISDVTTSSLTRQAAALTRQAAALTLKAAALTLMAAALTLMAAALTRMAASPLFSNVIYHFLHHLFFLAVTIIKFDSLFNVIYTVSFLGENASVYCEGF